MEAVFRTKNKDRKCDDAMCVVTVGGLVFGTENGLENWPSGQKTRTDSVKPTQPVQLSNQSYMISKDSRPVHKARKQASKLTGLQVTRHASKAAAGRQA